MKSNRLLKKEILIIDGVGDKYSDLLQKEGITSVGKLLDHDPLELSQKIAIPYQHLFEFKRKAELVGETVFDYTILQAILDWPLAKILGTSQAEIISKTGFTSLQVDELKYHIASLFVALDNDILKEIPLKDVIMIFPDVMPKEYFIKIAKDAKSIYIQDTPLDPGDEHLNIQMFTTDLLNGAARQNIQNVCVLWDEETKTYKAWIIARNPGKNQPWEICYSESPDIETWSAPQLLFQGRSEPNWGCNYPQSISVIKSVDGKYHMWYSIYYCPEWENMINYRSSSDGIQWDAEKLVLRPGGVSDDGNMSAVCLQNGDFRLYYWHQVEDYGPNTTRTVDIHQGAATSARDISASPRFIQAATIIGNQRGDTHHRIWQCSAYMRGELFMMDSEDEGQNWKETKIGNTSPSEYVIANTLVV